MIGRAHLAIIIRCPVRSLVQECAVAVIGITSDRERHSSRWDLRTATPVNLPSKPLRQAGDTLWEAPGC